MVTGTAEVLNEAADVDKCAIIML